MSCGARSQSRLGQALTVGSALILLVSAPGCVSITMPDLSSKSALEEAQDRSDRWRAATAMAEGNDQKPMTLAANLEQGDAMHERGDHQQALLSYLRAVKMDPDSSEPRRRIGYVQLAHDLDRAEAIFGQIVERDPTDASSQLGLSLAYLGQGRLDESLIVMQTALALNPDSAHTHQALAIVYSFLSRHEESLVHATRAVELNPSDAAAMNALGVTQLLMGDYETAEKAFHRAILIDPDVTTYRNNLGLALGRLERYDKAFSVFRDVADEQTARNNLGYTYFLNGRYDEAVLEYERALAESGGEKREILRNLLAAIDKREREAERAAVGEPVPPVAAPHLR